MLKKFGISDSEHKLLKDSVICLECFSAYKWYYNLEADTVKEESYAEILIMR